MSPGKPKFTLLYFKPLKQFSCKSEGKEQKTIETRSNPGYRGGFNDSLHTSLVFRTNSILQEGSKDSSRFFTATINISNIMARDFIMMIFKKVLKLPSMAKGNSFTFNHSVILTRKTCQHSSRLRFTR